MGTFEQIALELANILSRVTRRFSQAELPETLAQLGIIFPPDLLEDENVVNVTKDIALLAGNLSENIEALNTAIQAEDVEKIIENGAKLLADCVKLIALFSQLPESIDAVRGAFPEVDDDEFNVFASNFPRRFLDMLIVEQLDTYSAIGGALTFAGLIERNVLYEDAIPEIQGYELVEIHYERIAQLLGKPESLFKELYDWGNLDFDGSKLQLALYDLLVKIGIPAYYNPPSDSASAQLETFIFALRLDHTLSPPGLSFDISTPLGGELNLVFPLPHPAWQLRFKANGEFEAGFTGNLTPPLNFSLSTSDSSFEGGVEIDLVGGGSNPILLLGKTDSSRLEVGTIGISGGINFRWNSESGQVRAEPSFGGSLENGRIFIDASESDSFISDILSGVKIDSNFDVGFVWSLSNGIYFQGSSTIEIMLPVHIELGPVSIPEIYLVGGLDDSTIPIELSAALGANIGPLKASVERIGLLTNIEFTGTDGNAGPAQIDFAFKPPNGVGLAIDAGVVKGGGYLYFDFDREEYAGALELVFSGFLTLKAIGLITTRLPDGSKGFSLLIIITAEFGSGFQLGFGFVLLGVGGLLGLNRTMMLQPLTDGVRTGSVERILFPQNVIENAPRIISDLRRFFPPEEGIFLIGPMAKLGWGTPALITLSLGIIFEIPGNIAILGVLKVVLPDEKAPLLVLQVAFIGAIEFDKQRAYFFASIFESRILFITLEGEMGVLVAWGDDSNFVVSVGGFHPQFTPPPLPFPSPKRVSLNILNESWGRIRVMGYFAVTSNTVQLGARAELFFGFSALSVEGHLAFDALFQFDPFFFIIEISCGVSLKVFGIGLFSISLKFSLEGPTPWRAKGYGKLKLLFFSIKAKFDFTWGEKKDTSLPSIEVLPLLQGELEKLSNWKAQLPASSNLLVSLRMLEQGSESLVLHPVGTLRVTQRLVPLDLRLDKVGNQKPSDGKRFYLEVVGGLKKVGDLNEQFAIAQFQDFQDAEKLSQAPFQPEEAGLELAVADQSLATGKAVKRNIRYETHIIDTNFQFVFIALFEFVSRLFNHFLNGSVVTKSVVSQHYQQQFQPFDEKITLKPEQFVVASTVDNRAISQQAVFTSEAKAQEFMQAEIARDATRREFLHVIPSDEVNTYV